MALLVILAPAAYASPPDPTWIGGLWDDGDFDDAIIAIAGASAIAATPLSLAAPAWACLAHLSFGEVGFVPAPSHLAGSPRSPPSSTRSR